MQTNFSTGSASDLATDIELMNTGGADSGTDQSYTITLTADIALNAGLPAINLQNGSSLTIVGQGYSVDGSSAYSGLFLNAGSLILQDVTIENMLARGGAGQSETGNAGAGGGGAGLGGGLFIASGASATLSDAAFLNDAAIGGAGGDATPAAAPAGTPAGGLLNDSVQGSFGDGGAGAAGPSTPTTSLGPGSPGGFGGGGGGGAGTGTSGASGGFGAGDGAAVSDGQGLAGGGGLGAGGDVFVQQGGNLTIDGGTLSDGTASGGAGGATVASGSTLYAADGLGLDSGIFVQGNNTITLAPPSSDTEVIADTIGDESGASLPSDVGTGTGTLTLNIDGDVVLEAANSYTGGTTVETGGTLELSGSGNAGSGAITLDATSTLQLDGGISVGDVIVTDLATVAVNGTNAISGALSGFAWLMGNGMLQLDQSAVGSNLIVSYGVTLQLESAGIITPGDLLDLFDGTLDLNGFNQTLTNPVGFGTVLLGGATLTLGAPPAPVELDWAFTGPGLVDIPNDLTLTLDAPLTAQIELNQGSALTLTEGATSNGTIEFAGTGDMLSFDLQDGTPVTGTIIGFNSTDTIIVAGTVTAVNNTDAGLVLQDGSTILGTLDLVGSDSGDGFLTIPVSGTNTEIVLYQGSIDITPPIVAAGASVSYVARATPVTLDAGLSVSDAEPISLTGATVSISAGFLVGDTLSVGSPQTDITGNYNAGVLTLSGTASLAAYQAEFDSVAYNSSGDPTDGGADPSRTITWSVSDGTTVSAPVTSSLSVSFDSDPEADILLQNTDGQLALWQANSNLTLTAYGMIGPTPGPSWFAMVTGAFYTGDTSDVIWQNDNGAAGVWQVQGTTLLGYGFIQLDGASVNPGPSWHIEGTGDFYGDGDTNVLLQNDDGSVALWDLNGASIVQYGLVQLDGVSVNAGPSWHIEGTGDFYGDGNTDVLLQNDDGSVALWDLNGTSIVQSGIVSANPGPTWRINGTGDFYGDGKTDILWQNDNGTVAIWEMNGTTISQSGVIADPGPTWHVVGTGDFNGDGKTDIVLQNDDGTVAIWEMNGTTIASGAVVANPTPAWSVTGEVTMRFIQSMSAGETLAATPTTPEEFVFSSYAAGVHTITGFNPVQDMIELPIAQFASFAAVQQVTSAIAGGAMLNLGNGSSLVLPGVDPTSLHANNFVLA